VPRFVIFGTPGGDDVMVNVDQVVAVDQLTDNELGDDDTTCRLWLTTECWIDDEGTHGQNWVTVTGCLLDIHTMLNGRPVE
jgi:hypothetical protein